MVYIKYICDNIVQLGGCEATNQMIKDGWFVYEGEIPAGQNFKLVNGVLEAYTPEISPLMQVDVYQNYLKNTDYKMLPGYDPKEGENLDDIVAKRKVAREFIRKYQREVANATTHLL